MIADIVSIAIHTKKLNPGKIEIEFLKADTKPNKKKKPIPNILSPAINLVLRLTFLDQLAKSALCPDLVFFSNKLKNIVIRELTVPQKEHAEEVH